MFIVSSCSCLCPIHWSQMSSWEWRCSWSSADRRCSNYIWVINNFIAYQGASYIRDFTVIVFYQFGPRVLSLPASVCLCVCVLVYQSRVCPHDNSPLVKARITKVGVHVQKTFVKVTTVLEWSTLTFKVKFNLKVKFYKILSLSARYLVTRSS